MQKDVRHRASQATRRCIKTSYSLAATQKTNKPSCIASYSPLHKDELLTRSDTKGEQAIVRCKLLAIA